MAVPPAGRVRGRCWGTRQAWLQTGCFQHGSRDRASLPDGGINEAAAPGVVGPGEQGLSQNEQRQRHRPRGSGGGDTIHLGAPCLPGGRLGTRATCDISCHTTLET